MLRLVLLEWGRDGYGMESMIGFATFHTSKLGVVS